MSHWRYVVVAGSESVRLDDEVRDIRLWDLIRVAPPVGRAFEAGPDGLELIAVGGPRPEGGDGVCGPTRRGPMPNREASWNRERVVQPREWFQVVGEVVERVGQRGALGHGGGNVPPDRPLGGFVALGG